MLNIKHNNDQQFKNDLNNFVVNNTVVNHTQLFWSKYKPPDGESLLNIIEKYDYQNMVEEINKSDYRCYKPLHSIFDNAQLFEDMPIYNYNVSMTLCEYYGLNNTLIDKIMKGDIEHCNYNLLVCDDESVRWLDLDEDILEYNKIILEKRQSMVCNFVALMTIVYPYLKQHDDRLLIDLDRIGYKLIGDKVLIHKSLFLNEVENTLKDEMISVYFDGRRILSGRWKLSDIINHKNNTEELIFISEQSVYPLDLLCERKKYNKFMYFVNEQEHDYLFSNFDNKAMIYNINLYRINMFEAVPGSGKTTTMLKIIDKIKNKENNNYIIFVPTVNQKEELVEKGYNVKTVDSITHSLSSPTFNESNLNFELRKIHYVFFDEAYMIHSGQIRWLLHMLSGYYHFYDIYMFGDLGQIPYYSRTFTVCQHNRDIHNSVVNIKHLNETYRCPQNMNSFLNMVYNDVKIKSEEEGSITSVVATFDKLIDLINYHHSVGDVIITYTQVEKEIIFRKCNLIINTIHEVQGQTYDNVILVRLNYYQRTIYNDISHITVALTRHKISFVYFTIVEDYVSELIKKINNKEQLELPQKELSLGEIKFLNYNENEKESAYEPSELFIPDIIVGGKEQHMYPEVNPEPSNCKICIKDEVSKVKNAIANYGTNSGYYERSIHKVEKYMSEVDDIKQLLITKKINVDDVKFDAIKRKDISNILNNNNLSNGNFVAPQMPLSRIERPNILQVFHSIIKRNADVGAIRDTFMTISPDILIDNFFETFVDKEKFLKYKDNFIMFNQQYEDEWLKSRSVKQINKLISEMKTQPDMTTYHGFLKNIVKNKFDDTQYDHNQAAQVVAGAKSIAVGYFTPMVKHFTSLLNTVLKDEYLINDSITNEYMEWFVNNRLKHYQNKDITYKVYEMDYAKFDKNQDWLDLYYQILILKKFGVPESLLSEWTSVHMLSRLVLPAYGINMLTFTQRKSGDAFTFMGNTLFTMLMYSTFHKDLKTYCGLFGGDDSLIFIDSKESSKIDNITELIASAFNMELKVIDTKQSISFASKFFIYDDFYDKIFIYPDILKQMSRYNRKAKSKQHIYSQQISSYILDQNLFKYLNDNRRHQENNHYDMLLTAIKHRYKITEENFIHIEQALTSYLKLLEIGCTTQLYINFNKVREATPEEVEMLYMRISKKIQHNQIHQYQPKFKGERDLLTKWKTGGLVVIEDERKLQHKQSLDMIKLFSNNYNQIIDFVKSIIESYFDRNDYDKKELFKSSTDKFFDVYESIFLIIQDQYKPKTSLLKSIINMFSYNYLSSTKKQHVIKLKIKREMYNLLDTTLLYSALDKLLYNVRRNSGVLFRLAINISEN